MSTTFHARGAPASVPGLPVLDRRRIEQTDLPELVRVLRSTYLSDVPGTAITPARMFETASDPERAFGVMASISDRLGLFVTKVVAAVPAPGGGPTIGGVVTALSTRTGEPVACLDAAAITDLKCAAVTALVTDACTSRDVASVGLVGAGALAFAQVLGISAVREVRRWTVVSRRGAAAEAFAARLRDLLGPGAEVRVGDGVEAVLAGHDVVCTATSSTVPLVDSYVVPDGGHVNCMGGHALGSRELPNETLARACLIVEDRQTAVTEAGDVHREAIDLAGLAGLAASGTGTLRQRPTVFSSTGHALLDLVVTGHVLRSALGPEAWDAS